MSMRHGILLLSIAQGAFALDLGQGFTAGGYVEVLGSVEGRQARAIRHSATTPGETEWAGTMHEAGALRLGWRDEEFTARLDIIASDAPQFVSVGNVWVEQAFINWNASPTTTVRVGRFQNTWLGWEGFHTPDLWRVQHSAAWDWNVQNHSLQPNQPFVSDGIGVKFHDLERTRGAEFYVVNDVLGNGPDTRPGDKAVGASFWLAREGVGRVELGLAYDSRSTATGLNALGQPKKSADSAAIDLNADLTALRDLGWFFAAEVQFHHHPDLTVGNLRYGNDLIALAMANYAFTPTVSVTVMVNGVERGFEADDNEIGEVAVALLTQPRRLVKANIEAFYWHETAREADMAGVAAVLLVSLP